MSTPFDWAELEAELDDPANLPQFTPVPRRRARRNGWSPERQALFLLVLSRCGSVSRAARAVGKSARSAYHLLHAPGADSFAEAWDAAIEEGIERVRADALQHAIGGAFVPVFRKGKLVRVEHRRSDRLAVALLRGRQPDVDYHRQTAVARRHYRQAMARCTAEQEEKRRSAEEIWAEHQAVLDRIELEQLLGTRPAAVQPRLRSL